MQASQASKSTWMHISCILADILAPNDPGSDLHPPSNIHARATAPCRPGAGSIGSKPCKECASFTVWAILARHAFFLLFHLASHAHGHARALFACHRGFSHMQTCVMPTWRPSGPAHPAGRSSRPCCLWCSPAHALTRCHSLAHRTCCRLLVQASRTYEQPHPSRARPRQQGQAPQATGARPQATTS